MTPVFNMADYTNGLLKDMAEVQAGRTPKPRPLPTTADTALHEHFYGAPEPILSTPKHELEAALRASLKREESRG